MSESGWVTVWAVDTLPDGRIELTAPNGVVLMTVPADVADMVGRMLIDEAGLDDD